MQKDQDLKCLDELIAGPGGSNDAGTRSGSPSELLREHLQAARRALLGAMHDEYIVNLEQAKESLGCISDKAARAQIKKTLQNLIKPESLKQKTTAAANTKDTLVAPVELARAL